jgi:hypothetical protein
MSVMIAQRWETRVQRGTQPVRLKTGCTNFRLEIEPSYGPDNHPSQEPAKVQSTCKLPPLRTLLGGKLSNGKPPRKIPNPSSFFDNGQGGQPMALGLKALGPLGLWESLAARFCSLATITTTSAPTVTRAIPLPSKQARQVAPTL